MSQFRASENVWRLERSYLGEKGYVVAHPLSRGSEIVLGDDAGMFEVYVKIYVEPTGELREDQRWSPHIRVDLSYLYI